MNRLKKRFLQRIGILWHCKIMHSHNWTSQASKGIMPTKKQLLDHNGFLDYARIYCERCGKQAKGSLTRPNHPSIRNKAKDEYSEYLS